MGELIRNGSVSVVVFWSCLAVEIQAGFRTAPSLSQPNSKGGSMWKMPDFAAMIDATAAVMLVDATQAKQRKHHHPKTHLKGEHPVET